MKGIAIRLSLIFLNVTLFTFLSLVSMGAIEEGTQGNGILGFLTLAFSKLFYLFRFPTHTFLFSYLDGNNLAWGLAVNCLFWTITLHLILNSLRKRKKHP